MRGVDKHLRHPYAQPTRQDPYIEPPWADLDMRIRETTRLLWRAGFHPCDSGDGRSKPEDERALHVPHVFMVVRDPRELVAECERLHQLLSRLSVTVYPEGEGNVTISGTYDPANGLGLIGLLGVDDELLGLVQQAEQPLTATNGVDRRLIDLDAEIEAAARGRGR